VEALDLGCLIWGADINPTAVQNTQANLDWFSQSHISHQVGLASHVLKVFPADILQTQTVLPQSTLEAVVFEGFLGPPHLKTAKIDDYVKGLTKFYLGAFKNILPLLKSQGYLVAAIPAFVAADRVKTLRHLVDSCEKLGYTQVHEPLWYYRPQAIIRRQILVWQKK
jgi:tRNA G10  N-methylase Trm11